MTIKRPRQTNHTLLDKPLCYNVLPSVRNLNFTFRLHPRRVVQPRLWWLLFVVCLGRFFLLHAVPHIASLLHH
ncbi:hypothetical protein GE21DRAFT_1019807 [Neurospora crassa]|nr:hypothetical protein GE21DRAFT_1019807 [Neurospora crassa]